MIFLTSNHTQKTEIKKNRDKKNRDKKKTREKKTEIKKKQIKKKGGKWNTFYESFTVSGQQKSH